MEGEQEGGGEIEEKGSRRREAGTTTKPAMTIGVAEEAAIASADDNRACSNGGNREDKCGSSKGCGTRGRGSSKMGPLCDGGGQGKELFCLWGIWTYGPSLQKLGLKRQSDRQ